MNAFLGISMMGWILIGLVYVPVSIMLLVFAFGRWRSQPGKSVMVAMLMYVPLVAAVAEAMYVDTRFKALCATSGAQIKRSVVVDGLYDDGFRKDRWEDSLRSQQESYRFAEWKAKDGRLWRSERIGPGEVRRFPIDKPTARYHWFSPNIPSAYGHLMQRREETIVDSETGEVIARHVTGYRYPAFIDRLWSQFMGGGPEICGSGDILSKTLIGIDRKDK